MTSQELTPGGTLDDELIARCLGQNDQEGDDEAFRRLYDRHSKVVWAFLKRLLGRDEHAAMDALQETFFRFYTALASFKKGRPVRPWILTIARNVSLDYLKHSARKEQPQDLTAVAELTPSREQDPAQSLAHKELAACVRAAVNGLNIDEKAVFFLRKEAGLTFDQVADVLGCSVRTAKYRMKAALERIGRAVEQLGMEVK